MPNTETGTDAVGCATRIAYNLLARCAPNPRPLRPQYDYLMPQHGQELETKLLVKHMMTTQP